MTKKYTIEADFEKVSKISDKNYQKLVEAVVKLIENR